MSLVHLGDGYIVNTDSVKFICPDKEKDVIDIAFHDGTGIEIPYILLHCIKNAFNR